MLPKIVKHQTMKGFLILCFKYNANDRFSGIVLAADENETHFQGETSDEWVTTSFEDFNGEVTLSNHHGNR